MVSRRRILSIGLPGAMAAGALSTLTLAADVAHPAKLPDLSASGLRSRINSAIAEIDKSSLVKLAVDLCNVPSLLGHEAPAARFLRDYMRKCGLEVTLQDFAPDRANVLGVHKGTGRGRSLMFNGHLDVTPHQRYYTPFREWNSELLMEPGRYPSAQVDHEWITGMGVWNMKGPIAAYVAALAAVRKAGIELHGDVLIAGVAGGYDQTSVDCRIMGENIQGFSVGTKKLFSHGAVADMCIVGEPTSFKLVRETFGQTALRIDVIGKKAASLAVELLDFTSPAVEIAPIPLNAVEYASEIIQLLRRWIPDYRSRNRVEGIPPFVTIAAVEGGVPWAVEPKESTIFVFVGTPPGADPLVVLDEMESLLGTLPFNSPNFEVRASLYSVNPGPSIPAKSCLVEAIQAAHVDIFAQNVETRIAHWHSAASPLSRYGVPTVTYGMAGKISLQFDPAGNLAREIEAVRIKDLIDCARVYVDLIVRVCSERHG